MEKKREEICLGAKSMHGTKWTQWIIGAYMFFLKHLHFVKDLRR